MWASQGRVQCVGCGLRPKRPRTRSQILGLTQPSAFGLEKNTLTGSVAEDPAVQVHSRRRSLAPLHPDPAIFLRCSESRGGDFGAVAAPPAAVTRARGCSAVRQLPATTFTHPAPSCTHTVPVPAPRGKPLVRVFGHPSQGPVQAPDLPSDPSPTVFVPPLSRRCCHSDDPHCLCALRGPSRPMRCLPWRGAARRPSDWAGPTGAAPAALGLDRTTAALGARRATSSHTRRR